MKVQPRALIRLVQALNQLADLAQPTTPPALHDPGARRGSAANPTMRHAVDGTHWTRTHQHYLRRIEDLARDIETAITGRDDRPPQRRCTCGGWLGRHDHYCRRCGQAVTQPAKRAQTV